jgi:hypothetical protein
MKDLENCLAYCREQNGMNQCKNCGLSQEMIDGIKQEHKAELEMIKGELQEYFEGLIHVPNPQLTGNNIIAILDSHINKLSTE